MEPRNIDIDYKELYQKALLEIEEKDEQIELQDNCIDELRRQIENQQNIIRGLELKAKCLDDKVDEVERENAILKAQMDVVRMIFGGRGNG